MGRRTKNDTIPSPIISNDTSSLLTLNKFYTISDGGYAELLFDLFGKDRVELELFKFLSHDFIPRYGGGIGVTRMISAMKRAGLIVKNDQE